MLTEALVFLAAAVVFATLFRRLGLGSVIGFLVAGAVIGPHGLAMVADVERAGRLAELGVVLLLFVVGLELRPARLWELRRAVFGLGGLQVLVTGAVLAALGRLLGLPPAAAILAGVGLSFSSTALVLQLLGEQGEQDTRHSRTSFGILLFQDLAVIPLLAVVPMLEPDGPRSSPLTTALLAVAALAVVTVGARFLVRPALRLVARLRSPELFTATALLVVLGTAAIVRAAGLSMALGAFLAGVVLADSEYRHEIEADLEPFKGMLLGLFFVTVGMSVDLALVAARPGVVLGLAAGIVAVKGLLLLALLRFVERGRPGAGETAAATAALLANVGEFAFVLVGMAGRARLLAPGTGDLLVAAASLTLPATPLLFVLHMKVIRPRLARAGAPRAFDVAPQEDAKVVIAGFGRVGQVVGRVLAAKHVPFTALDASPEHIDFIRRFGNKVFYGDASRIDLLRAARVDRARLFVLAIDDPEASTRVAETVLREFPQVELVARARNRQHAYALRNLGVRRVFRETLASSVEMTGDVLGLLGMPAAETAATLARFRAHDEALLEATYPFHRDERKLAEMAIQGRKELEELFARDVLEQRAG